MAAEFEDVDFGEAEGGEEDNNGWETEDEAMEAEQDDSELTFSKHTGNQADGCSLAASGRISYLRRIKLLTPVNF